MVSGRMERVGLRAVVEGIGTYVRDARKVNKAQQEIGQSATTAATKSENLDKKLRAVGARMAETGRQAVFLGAAITGIAAGPAFLAARFESQFVKIENLVGESREALQGMKADVLAISRETARGPQELAEALFVIESGGLRGAEALETLRAAASASALGMGATNDIARITTQALIAFRDQNLTAAEAVDVLVGTARAGNFETSQLAGVFGRVLPLAAELGIKFSDLGGFVAAYTRVGGDAANATTALSAVLITLTRGGQTAQDTLNEVGLSLGELKTIATEQGLAQALIEILRAVEEGGGAAEEKLALIIPNIRALRGVLATAGVQSEAFLRIQEEVANSLGLTSEGLERLDADPLFQFQQAVNELQVSLVELGQNATPALTTITFLINGLAGALTALPAPLQSGIVIFAAFSGAILIAGGTLGIFVGQLVQMIASMPAAIAAIKGFQIASFALAGPLGLAGLVVAIVAVAAAYAIFTAASRAARDAQLQALIVERAVVLQHERTREELSQIIALQTQLIRQQEEILALADKEAKEEQVRQDRKDGVHKQAVEELEDIEGIEEALRLANAEREAAEIAIEAQTEAERAAAQQALELELQIEDLTGKINDATAATRSMSSAALAAALATEFLNDAMKLDASGGFEAALNAARDRVQALIDKEDELAAFVGLLTFRGFDSDDGGSSGGAATATGIDSFADDVASALARARQAAESELNLLGDLITRALRRSAAAQRDLALQAISDQRDAQRDAHEERLRQIDEEETAALRAIEANLEAQLGPLRAELEALQGERDTEDRADIERRLALAFDARERARIEDELREHDRRAREDEINDQIRGAQDAAEGQIDAVESSFNARREAQQRENDLVLDGLAAQRDAAQDAYAAATDAFTLESEARRLILEDETDAMTALLEAQVPEWRSAGLSMGQALLDGIRQGGAGAFVGGLAGGLERGAGAGGTGARGASPADVAQVQQLQLAGITNKENGAPEFVLASFRKQIQALGGTPAFHQGGIVGGTPSPGREVMVRALPGEGIFTRDQMAALSRPVFEPGAFRGMFEGAHFDGDAQENAAAVEARFERMMERVLTRGASTAGARSQIA